MFPDNSYLSAILDRQGVEVAPQLIQGFWKKLKKNSPKIVVMSRLSRRKTSKRKKWYGKNTNCVLTLQNIKFLDTSLFWDRNQEKLVVEKGTILPEKVPLPMDLLRGKKPKWIFHNLGNLLRPQELVPASRGRVVPAEWQVRTVLGDCVSRAKVIPAQAPQYQQYALISDFLDFAHLSIGEEAALAANWIKDRPEGLKLQNLTLSTRTGRVLRSLPRNLTADVQYAINKWESLGPRQQLFLYGNPSTLARDFSPHMTVLRRHSCRMSLPVLNVTSGHPRWRF